MNQEERRLLLDLVSSALATSSAVGGALRRLFALIAALEKRNLVSLSDIEAEERELDVVSLLSSNPRITAMGTQISELEQRLREARERLSEE